MSNALRRSSSEGLESLLWRLIPLRSPPFLNASLVAVIAFAAAIGLRLAVLGLPIGWGASSTFFPAYIVLTLYAGLRWGWASVVFVMVMSVATTWYRLSAPGQIGILCLFAFSSAVTVVVAGALRATLQRLQREAAARTEAEALLRLAEEAGGLGLWDWDLQSGASTWSKGVFHNLGMPVTETPPTFDALLDSVHPDDRQKVIDANDHAMRKERFYQIDYRQIGADGQERWIHARGQVHRDEDGKPRRLVGYNIDVTTRYRAAEQLRESEERFRSLADSAPAMLWLSVLGGARDFVNTAYVTFVGGTYQDALTLDWRSRIHADDLQRILTEQLAGESSLKPFVLEARYQRGDGEWRWLKSFSQPRFGPSGDFSGFGGIAFDVTEAKQVEADLQRINDLLAERVEAAVAERDEAQAALAQSQKLEALGQLTGGVAHDFNNLLTVITGALDIVQRHPEDAPRTARLTKAALAAAQRGERLTRQLLAFSRRQPLRPEVVVADDLIRECETLYGRALGERYSLDLDLGAPGLQARIDPGQFDAAVMNLLVNARDAMAAGGVVTLSTRITRREAGSGALSSGEYLAVSVRDAGEGMDEATKARVFEPFFSTKPVGKGTGLGLSQVYGFVRQSGGAVTIDSEPGQGATVTLLLPLATGPAEPEREAPTRQARVEGLTVVLVEDEPEVAALAEAMLRELGHEVHFAETPQAALALIKTSPRFNLLLTDLVMPGDMSGVDLATEVTKARPGLPVLLSSGYTGEVLTSAEDAPWPLLRKPYTLDMLAAALDEAVESTARQYVNG